MSLFMKISLFVIVILILVYFIPNPKKHFRELYKGNDDIADKLERFRKYPLKSIKKDGRTWQYIDTGNGGETILFLHGMGGAYDIWFQQIEALKKDFRIISVTYSAVNSLEEMAAGITGILDAEGIDKVHVVGSSLGGYIAQFLLKNHGDRLEKIVLSNTFPPNTLFRRQNEGLGRIISWLPEWLLMRTFRENLKAKVVPASGDNPLVEAYLLEQDYGLMSKKQFIGRFHCVMQYFEPLSSGNHPVLIIESDNDPLVPKVLHDSLKMLYPHAQVHTFPDQGHFPYLSAPDEYTQWLYKFLGGDRLHEKKAISGVIENYYFKGRKAGDVELLKKAFVEDAMLITVENGKEKAATLRQYLNMVSDKGPVTCTTTLLAVDLEGDIGIAKTKFDYGPVIYYDYLVMEKRGDQWKIARKYYVKKEAR